MSARDDVLGRVRQALVDVAPDDSVSVARPTVPGQRADDLVGLFAQRVADYRASVRLCSPDAASVALGELIAAGDRLVVPDGFPQELLPDGADVVGDDPGSPLTPATLDQMDAVITTCALGIATTGTIVLDHGPGQGRRALTLVPDRHICVVHAGQIVPDVPDAIARLDPMRVQTWISGPSATSDIELSRVEGVHGPRTLHVIVTSA
ncbi:MAG TPA: LUD domain-containing protein [Jiangellaceae bacterium]|nr:LUD domain-containing protein [Jiangellaceae bacterium]